MPIELLDDLVLTQYGEQLPDETTYRNRLRVHTGETEISLILGRVDALAAAVLVTKVANPIAVVRHTTVGELRSRGFIVRHSPTRGNRLHVSVFSPLDGSQPVEWDDKVAALFDECFTEGEGGEHGGADIDA